MTDFSENSSPVALLDDFREALLDELRELATQFEGGFDGLEYTLLFPPQELADEDTTLNALRRTDDDSVLLVFNDDVELDAESLAVDDLAGLREALSELVDEIGEEGSSTEDE